MATKGILKVCKNGHQFYKSSDCPTCPICEKERKPTSGFLSLISGPARRALEHAGIKTLNQLSKQTEAEILKLPSFAAMVVLKVPSLRKSFSE